LKDELGKSVGLPVGTSAAAIVKVGKAKDAVNDIAKKVKTLKG
jgi:ribosomal protein L7Ae-like RNA K-turn-binding protein